MQGGAKSEETECDRCVVAAPFIVVPTPKAKHSEGSGQSVDPAAFTFISLSS